VNTAIESPDHDPGYLYGPDEYFAFVESLDPLIRSGFADPKSDPIELLLDKRRVNKFAPPSKVIWLDCVQSQYFMRLPWKDDVCEIGNAEQSALRRQQVRQLDRAYFRVALLLVNPEGLAEQGTFDELKRAALHRVVLSTQQTGIPVIVAPDFDLESENREHRQLRYMGLCSLSETKSLSNAFSLNFLPDARMGDLERGNPNTPPRTPSPRRGKGGTEIVIEISKPMVIRYEEPGVEKMVRYV